MTGSDTWSKEKSDFSQQLHAFKKEAPNTDAIIKQLDFLLSANNNLDNKSLQELADFIISAKLPLKLEELLLSKVGDQKTEIAQISSTSASQKNNAHEELVTHSSSLLKNLLEYDENTQTTPIEPGQIIRSTYCLELKIGRGGMGQVWKALDLIQDAGESNDKYVAIKFINQEIRSHPDILKALVREFARYKKLIHPNIVKAYELNRDGNNVYIVMEHLEGGELKDFIRQNPKGISLKQAQPIIKGMCDALEYAHKQGIVHLDFKPGNVFYNPEKQVCKVIDFGIARLSDPEERDKTRFDPGALGAMTTAYASSEMLMEADPDPKDDIYGLACVVYELLSGHHPFDKSLSLKAEREKMQVKQISGLSKGELQALQHGLSFRRDDRTGSAQAFYAELFSPQQLADKKRTKWLVIGSIIAASAIAIPFIAYKAYNNWQLSQVSTNIEQQLSSGVESFVALSVDEQHELLSTPAFRLALVEYASTQKDLRTDALTLLSTFDSSIQQKLFADSKVREYLIEGYSTRVDQAIDADEFQLAQQLSQQIQQQYPDSMRLVNQANSIQPQKSLRQAELQQSYQQCLTDSAQTLLELFPCLQQTGILLAKINPAAPAFTAETLNNRYNKEVSAAISANELAVAESLIGNWYQLENNTIDQRLELEKKLAHANKVEQFISQIKAGNNLQLVNILGAFPQQESEVIKDVLSDASIRQRLIGFYQETVTQYLNEHDFNAASQRAAEGRSLLSESRKESKTLKLLAKKVEQQKSAYLKDLESLYKKQLSEKEPDIQAIQKIQQKLLLVEPNSPVIQLPGLSGNYIKKIDIAISKDQYELAQRLLDGWKVLKPSDVQTDAFTQLADKKQRLLQAFEDRKKVTLQLQNVTTSNDLFKINEFVSEIKKQFSEADQEKILSANKEQLISVYQQHISSEIQRDAFASAMKIAAQLQTIFPKNKEVQGSQRSIVDAKNTRIAHLILESENAINAGNLEGSAIFSPLLVIRFIDTEYLTNNRAVFLKLQKKLIELTSEEQPLTQLKSVIIQWDKFLMTANEQAEKNQEQLKKTKNLIALRCLFNGRKFKMTNQKKKANEFFMFGLSLEPIDTVRIALEKELLR